MFLNNAGKEILIKVMLMTIPTYIMTLFCLPKIWCGDIGDMGFRDMVDFNTMLMKMAWRLQDERDAIWAKVMKRLYFPRCKFMDAKKGARHSWAGASILFGRDVMKANDAW